MSFDKPGVAWVYPQGLDSSDIVVKVHDQDQDVMRAIGWLDENMDHELWDVFPRVGLYLDPITKRIAYFHFDEKVDRDLLMLFKLTFGGQ